MSFLSKILKKNNAGEIVPQYYNAALDDNEALQGANGAAFMQLVGGTLKDAALKTVTAAGTRVQLPNVPCSEVTIIARRTNTGYIYAGKVTVSSSVFGVELEAKGSYTFNVNNANEIWLDSSVSGEGVSYVAI